MRPSCLIKVPSSLDSGTFFHWWIRFLNPFHDLTSREMDVTAAFFQYRYELSKTVADPMLLDKLAIDSDARTVVKTRLQLSGGYINVILSKLRKCGIVKDNKLNPRFIPDIKIVDGKAQFSALIVFDFKEDEKKAQI